MNEQISLLKRYSTPAKLLVEPAPDEEQLKQILELAMHAPDHGRLNPYRFISIRGEARHALSRVFGEAVRRRDPDAHPEYLHKQMEKPLRSPLIVVVVASLIESNKIPEIEQVLSAGAAAHTILLASNAMGFGSIWLTGDHAYDEHVREALGVEANERIVGFIYLGTEDRKLPVPDRPPVDSRILDWTG